MLPVSDRRNTYELSQKAIEYARERLKAEGVVFPVWDGKSIYGEHYERSQKYSELEATYYVEFLRKHGGGEPKEAKSKPKPREPEYHKEWKSYGEKDD